MATPAKKKVALVTGITGQDGSYLVELLLEKGYEVHGIKRRASTYNHARVEHIVNVPGFPHAENFFLHYGDLTDLHSVCSLIQDVRPDELYNLAAQSHVHVSFQMPMMTAEVDGIGCLNMLEALRMTGQEKTCKFYQASTSELYGKVREIPQSETTPFYPRSPYAVAKQFAFWACVNYRESYGMFAVNGILFNHESPRRGETFVTRKVTMGVANILRGKQECLYMGNLDAKRDWGHARDYVEGMWRILQVDEPDDFVIATGVTTSVREFIELSFAHVGMEIRWEGEAGTVDERGVVAATGKTVVRVHERYFRPAEVEYLLGDPAKAKKVLGWNPQQTSLKQLVEEMVDADVRRVDYPMITYDERPEVIASYTGGKEANGSTPARKRTKHEA